MASQNINLFQTKTALHPLLGIAERYVRIASTIVLSVLFAGGVVVGIAFFVFGQQRENLETEREQRLANVKNNIAKETLFVMIKNRIGAIDTVTGSQISQAPLIDTTMKVIQTFPLASFTMGEKNAVSISVRVTSVQEAMSVFRTLMDMEQKKEIANPVMQSFALDEKQIQIGLSYTVVL